MNSVNFTVLDIGHGNCSLISSDENFTIIDAAQGSVLLDILLEKNIHQIDDLIISHSDQDHIGGAIAILLNGDIHVKNVRLNPHAMKGTATWDDFRTAVCVSKMTHETIVHTAINRDSNDLDYGDYRLEVLAPCPIDCITGPDTISVNGTMLDANSMSVVLKLYHDDAEIALIPGDMDKTTLEFLKSQEQCLKSKVLVFPHHGGMPGTGTPQEFSKELCELVNPELIVFSNSRFKHNNPRPEIIAGVRAANCNAHMACTQMSKSCCEDESDLSNEHLMTTFPSKGQLKRHSCAGSITLALNGENTDVNSPLSNHIGYIRNFSSRKCL